MSLRFELSQEENEDERHLLSGEIDKMRKEYLKFAGNMGRKYVPLASEYKEIHSILKDKDTVIVEFFFSSEKSCAFVLGKDMPLEVVPINLTQKELNKKVYNYLKSYKEYKTFPSAGYLSAWKNKMKSLLKLLYQKLFSGLKNKLSSIKKIIFIPHKALFLVPLHAMIDDNGKYLIEKYEISYAPSIQVLQICSDRKRRERDTLFSFFSDTEKNTENKLEYSSEEVEGIRKLFSEYKVTNGETYEDIVDKASQNSILHFSCHGNFYSNDVLSSGLSVFNKRGEKVFFTLRDIFSRLSLPQVYMVVLSACETGMIEPEATDEFIGLPSAFMLAGAPSVIGSLWAVPDISTSKLMERFYHYHLEENMSKSASLKEAQKAVMVLKYKDLKVSSKMTVKKSSDDKIIRDPDLSHPYYWAAFCCYGAD